MIRSPPTELISSHDEMSPFLKHNQEYSSQKLAFDYNPANAQ